MLKELSMYKCMGLAFLTFMFIIKIGKGQNTCPDGKIWNETLNDCADCPDGTYWKSATDGCDTCKYSCKTCSTTEDTCLSCVEKYFLNKATSNCESCEKYGHCEECSDTECSKCEDGRIYDSSKGICVFPCLPDVDGNGSYDDDGTGCKKCQPEHCGECKNDQHKCTMCAPLYEFKYTTNAEEEEEVSCVEAEKIGGIRVIRIDNTKKRYKKAYIAFLVLFIIFFVLFIILLIVYLTSKGSSEAEGSNPVSVEAKESSN